MNIVIFGPPGAGKGTQSNLIAEKFKLYQLSTGELLRKEIKDQSKLGSEISSIILNKYESNKPIFKFLIVAKIIFFVTKNSFVLSNRVSKVKCLKFFKMCFNSFELIPSKSIIGLCSGFLKRNFELKTTFKHKRILDIFIVKLYNVY